MRQLTLIFISLGFCYPACYAQKKTIYLAHPNWNCNSRELILAQHVKIDSAWYTGKENDRNRSLAMIAHYDSLGNLTDRKELGPDGELIGFSEYLYADTMLLQEVRLHKSVITINGYDYTKEINTYDHNDSGYVVTEKNIFDFGDPLKSKMITEWNRDYDSVGHITKEYIKLPNAKPYLHHTYTYSDGRLSELKTFNSEQIWTYSYLYYYDDNGNLTNVFLYNSSKSPSHELFYEEKKLVMEKDYSEGFNASDYTSQTYIYKTTGLVGSQPYETTRGEKYYYAHYYYSK